MEWISNSPEETLKYGQELLSLFPDHEVICLRGALGTGKTHFTKGVGRSLDIPEHQIKSPTFLTVLEHEGTPRNLIHADFYRHEDPSTLDIEWLSELFARPNHILVMEWAERIEPHLPTKRLDIEFVDLGENQRKISFNPLYES